MTRDLPAKKVRKRTFPSLAETGRYRTDTAKGLQMEIIHAYAQLSRSWLERVQSEAALWANLGTKVASCRSLEEILEAQKRCVSDQMQMTVENGQQLFDDCQKITRDICELARSTFATTDVKQHGV